MPICHPSASVACSGKFLKRPGRHPFPPGYSSRARLRDAPARRRQWMLFRRPDKYLSTSFSLSVGTTLIDTYIQECNTLRQKRRLGTKGRYRKVHIHLYRRSLEHNYLPYRTRSHTKRSLAWVANRAMLFRGSREEVVSEVWALLEELEVWVSAPPRRPPWTPTSTSEKKTFS